MTRRDGSSNVNILEFKFIRSNKLERWVATGIAIGRFGWRDGFVGQAADGTGMRLMEGLHLRAKDVDVDRQVSKCPMPWQSNTLNWDGVGVGFCRD